ncbi:MAG TPA: Maf family protein [Terriglobales bacterium]|nr:Maf family protein [Terriglobales bacterium]
MPLILASASPRRQELLRNAGIGFTVKSADVPERRRARESPLAFARRLAREKAAAVFARHPQDFVLGADTIVVVGGEILEKPRNAADARRMLRRLSGRSHRVITAVCLLGPDVEDVRARTTRVTFARLSAAEIRDYVATGEPLDKAGAYAIQGLASRWATRIEGCYFNVVGLPVPMVYAMLRRHGVV